MTARSQLIRTWLLYPIAGIVITLAVLIGALRLLLPMVPRYQSEIREWASTATGFQIAFRTLSASWNWTGPMLSFYDVRITDSRSTEPVLIARGLSVGVSPWRILRDREISLARIGVQGAQVQAERSADGKWIVQGRPLEQLLHPRRPDAPPVEVELQDIAVGYVDRHRQNQSNAVALTLQRVHLTLTDKRLAAEADLLLPIEYGRRLSVTAELPGPLIMTPTGMVWPASWRAGFSGTDLDLVRVLDLTIGDHGPLRSARGALSASLEFIEHRAESIHAEATLADLRIGDGPAPAAYEQVAGRFAWARSASGWDASAKKLILRRGQREWPASEVELHYVSSAQGAPAEWRTRASFLRLEDIYPTFRSLTTETEYSKSLPQRLRGDLRDLDATFAAQPGVPTRFSLHVAFDKFGYTDAAGGIAADGVTGSVGADGDGGRLQLDCTGASLTLQEWFREALTADRLQGLLIWRSAATGQRILSDDVRVETAGMQIRTRFELEFPADHGSPVIDLKALASAAKAREVLRYLPLKRFPPGVVDWLERAVVGGEMPKATVEFRGPVREFPFDQGQGTFRADLEMKNATLDYASNWPPVEQLDANAVFDGVSLLSKQNHARVGNLVISDFDVRIPDLRKGILQVSGRQHLGLDQLFTFVRSTPVAAALGPTFARLTAAGPVTAALELSLPVTRPKEYELQVTFDGEGASVALPGLPVAFDKIRGRAVLHDTKLTADALTGVVLEEPVSLKLVPAEQPDALYSHTAELHGEFPVTKVMEAFHLPLPDQFSGRFGWDAVIRVPSRRLQTTAPLRIDLRSDLRGVASTLPRPLSKSPDAIWPTELNLVFPKDDLIEASGRLSPPLTWALRLEAIPNGWRVERGAVNLGTAPVSLPAEPGIELSGGISELHLSDWLKLGTGDGRGFRELYRTATFGIGRLSVAGQTFRDVFAVARRGNSGWAVEIQSPNAVGHISVPFDTKNATPITLDMERLWLMERDAEDPGRADPRNLPALEIKVEDAAMSKWHFGELQATVTRSENGLIAKPIVIRGPSFAVDGEGSWRVDPISPDQQVSSLQLAARSTDIADTLDQLGFDRIISGRGGKLDARLSWPGPPSAQFLELSSGQLGLAFDKGQLLDVEPGGGRLLGLLSLAALPRRLSLDFRDVFNKGLAFDTIKGDFRVVSGTAYTCNLGLEGPSAAMGIIGRTGIAAKDYDQLAVVRPQVSNMLNIGTIGGVVLGGPVGGVTMLLISQIFRKPLATLGESYYRVSGKWDKPVVDRIQRSQVDAGAFKDCERELAATLQALPAPSGTGAPTPARPPGN